MNTSSLRTSPTDDGHRRSPPWWIVSAWVSTAMIGLSLGLVIAAGASLVTNAYLFGMAAFPIVGGLVARKRPENLIGRLLSAAAFGLALGTLANSYLWLSLDVSRPSVALAAWLATWIWWVPMSLVVVTVAVFPSGSVTSDGMRPVLRVGLAIIGVLTLASMVVPAVVNAPFYGEDFTNPWTVTGLESWGVVGAIVPAVFAVLLAVVTLDLARRWRKSWGVERLQMRWVGFGLLVVAVVGVAAAAADLLGMGDALLVVVWLGFGVLPVTIGLAVTRYKLFDIDRLVSRTISYVIVAAGVAAVFSALVLGVPFVLPATLDSPALVASATLMAAAIFNPMRRKAQTLVDRRFNRASYDAQQEVERFARHLRSHFDVHDIESALVGVLGATVQPVRVAIWVRQR